MTKYAEELDTATAVLAAARAVGRCRPAEADLLQAAVYWAAMHSVDSIEDAATIADRYGDTGMPVAGEGAPLVAEFAITEFAAAIGVSTDAGQPVRRPRPGAVPTGSRGSGAAWSRVTSGRGWRAGSPTRPSSSHPRRVVCGPARRACGAQDRTRPARTARGRGDRDLHARPRRGTPVGESRRPVLHHRAAADLLRRHRGGARRARPGRRPRPRTSRRRVRRAAEGPRLGGLAECPPRGRGRGARPPPARPRPEGPVVEEGAPSPSRNHHRPKRQVVLYVHLSRAALGGTGTASSRTATS